MTRTNRAESVPKPKPRQIKRNRQREAMERPESQSLPWPDPPRFKPLG